MVMVKKKREKIKFSMLLGLGRETYISMLSQSLTKLLHSLQTNAKFLGAMQKLRAQFALPLCSAKVMSVRVSKDD